MQTRLAATIGAALAAAVVFAGFVAAQQANPRFGKWKLKQAPPATNIMTYESAGSGGMKVTVESKNAQGREQKWTYTTMLDGTDVPIDGHPSADMCSVKKIDDRTNEITNKRGVVLTDGKAKSISNVAMAAVPLDGREGSRVGQHQVHRQRFRRSSRRRDDGARQV